METAIAWDDTLGGSIKVTDGVAGTTTFQGVTTVSITSTTDNWSVEPRTKILQFSGVNYGQMVVSDIGDYFTYKQNSVKMWTSVSSITIDNAAGSMSSFVLRSDAGSFVNLRGAVHVTSVTSGAYTFSLTQDGTYVADLALDSAAATGGTTIYVKATNWATRSVRFSEGSVLCQYRLTVSSSFVGVSTTVAVFRPADFIIEYNNLVSHTLVPSWYAQGGCPASGGTARGQVYLESYSAVYKSGLVVAGLTDFTIFDYSSNIVAGNTGYPLTATPYVECDIQSFVFGNGVGATHGSFTITFGSRGHTVGLRTNGIIVLHYSFVMANGANITVNFGDCFYGVEDEVDNSPQTQQLANLQTVTSLSYICNSANGYIPVDNIGSPMAMLTDAYRVESSTYTSGYSETVNKPLTAAETVTVTKGASSGQFALQTVTLGTPNIDLKPVVRSAISGLTDGNNLFPVPYMFCNFKIQQNYVSTPVSKIFAQRVYRLSSKIGVQYVFKNLSSSRAAQFNLTNGLIGVIGSAYPYRYYGDIDLNIPIGGDTQIRGAGLEWSGATGFSGSAAGEYYNVYPAGLLQLYRNDAGTYSGYWARVGVQYSDIGVVEIMGWSLIANVGSNAVNTRQLDFSALRGPVSSYNGDDVLGLCAGGILQVEFVYNGSTTNPPMYALEIV